MDSGPLIQANHQSLREMQPAVPSEFQRQLGPNIFAPLPSQDSALRDYLRILIKRRWVILATLAGSFWRGRDRDHAGHPHLRRLRQHRHQ